MTAWKQNARPVERPTMSNGLLAYGFIYRIKLECGSFCVGAKRFFTDDDQAKESDWQDFYGDSKEFKAMLDKVGKENSYREIIQVCFSKESFENADGYINMFKIRKGYVA